MDSNNEIVIYRSDEVNARLEVRIENETVWLNRNQLASLFERDVKTIGKHIANALNEELHGLSVVAKFATTASDGKTYQVEHYNLDMIISIGYRVKSSRGVQFRIWANQVLKDHLLQGYSIARRLDRIEDNVHGLLTRMNQFEVRVNADLPPKQGVFFQGQVYDAYRFTSELIRRAKKSLIVIDNYIDDSVLTLLSKRGEGVAATLYTKSANKQLRLDLAKHNSQYPAIALIEFKAAHDRFLILDDSELYHFGASLKDLGKKWFAFSKMEMSARLITDKLPPAPEP